MPTLIWSCEVCCPKRRGFHFALNRDLTANVPRKPASNLGLVLIIDRWREWYPQVREHRSGFKPTDLLSICCPGGKNSDQTNEASNQLSLLHVRSLLKDLGLRWELIYALRQMNQRR